MPHRVLLPLAGALAVALATAGCGLIGGSAATPTATAATATAAPTPAPTPSAAQGRLTINTLPPGPPVVLNSAQCVVRSPDGRSIQLSGAVPVASPTAGPTVAATGTATPAAAAKTTPTAAPTTNPAAAAVDPARVNVVVEHRGLELVLDCQILMQPGQPGPAATPASGTTPAAGQPTPAAKPGTRQVQTTDIVNFRAAPSSTGQIQSQIPAGTTVEVIGEQTVDGAVWLNVRYNNQTGWIAAQFTRTP